MSQPGYQIGLGHALSMLGAAALAVWLRDAALVAWVGTGSLVLWGFRTGAVRFPGNQITLLRALGVGASVLVCSSLVASVLLSLVFVLDGVDGAVARRTNTVSQLGAELDKECDAFFMMQLSTLLLESGHVGVWVMLAGVWRYGYVVACRVVAIRSAPRSNIARYSYSTASVLLLLSLAANGAASAPLAALATVVITLSFGRSLYWGLR